MRYYFFTGGENSPNCVFLLPILLAFLERFHLFHFEEPWDDSCKDETADISFTISIILWHLSFGLFLVDTSWVEVWHLCWFWFLIFRFNSLLDEMWVLLTTLTSHNFFAEISSSLKIDLGSYFDIFLSQVQMQQQWFFSEASEVKFLESDSVHRLKILTSTVS